MKIGCDIQSISDFTNLKLAFKILSEEELKIFDLINSTQRKTEFLAGRWCAKEAILKAIDNKIKFKDISIVYQDKKPFWKNSAEHKTSISISHSKDYAMGVAIIE